MITLTRRQLIAAGAAAVSVCAAAPLNAGTAPKYRGKIYKSQIVSKLTDADAESIKKTGYDGVEVSNWNISQQDGTAQRELAVKHGLKIHSVMRAWTTVNNTDTYVKDIESVRTALKSASFYGADTVLWVPCKIGGFPNPSTGKYGGGPDVPAAWDFDIDFDPETLKVKSVAQDGKDYGEYMIAQNNATEASLKAVEELLPTAAYYGVRIGLENVWNNLWTTPKFYAAFVNYFKSPWAGAYFDLGNHAMYADPVEWLKAIGSAHLYKLHIKGFKVREVTGKLGGGPGNWSKMDEASIDWKAVRQTLSDLNYNGWVSVEDNGRSMEEYSEILDAIIGAVPPHI